MRYLASALSLGMLVGCHHQTSSFTNPFMPPDRVPPPSTQQLTPGTAQPYYPGGPVQPAPPYTGQPTVPPAMPGQASPLAPITPAASPNGWNGSLPSAPGSASRSPVYGGQPPSAYSPGPPVSHASPVVPAGAAPQIPGQVVLPVQYEAPVAQRPVVRELTAAEWQYTPGAGAMAAESKGFQPQGSASLASGSAIVTQPITR